MTRLLLALALLAAATPAFAQDTAGNALTGTLRTILGRGTIRVGVRDAIIPFAFRNPGGQPVGFSVDLCHAIAQDVATLLNLDLLEPGAPIWQQGLRLAYVPITPDERLPKLVAGDIDLECGSTTATAERAKTVAFSPVFFLAGTKLLVPAGSPVASIRDLPGKTVAVAAGTTNAEILRRLATRGPAFTITETPDLPAALALLAANQAAAFASDDILLAGLLATNPNARQFRIVGDYLSYEPYAIAYRRDDPALATLVTNTFARMAAEGTLRTLYRHWFMDRLPNGATLGLPMSPELSEMFRAMGEPD